MTVFIHTTLGKRAVTSLAPYLYESHTHVACMEIDLVPEEYRSSCRWLQYGLRKGVTDPKRGVSVLGIPQKMVRGLHGELIQGFPGVDPVPHCYEDDHHLGFGGFMRWVYFADQETASGFFGLDWSLHMRTSAGVATNMLAVCAVAQTCVAHGIPGESELVLLNWRMLEPLYMRSLRQTLGLHSVNDWAWRGVELFRAGSIYCPRCGQATLGEHQTFCCRCGCKPELVREGGHHGLEI